MDNTDNLCNGTRHCISVTFTCMRSDPEPPRKMDRMDQSTIRQTIRGMNIISEKVVTTRKRHQCAACQRRFEPGTRMLTQVNTCGGDINTWRTCSTCTVLIEKYSERFINDENVYPEGCVSEELSPGQTPEDLLKELNHESQYHDTRRSV